MVAIFQPYKVKSRNTIDIATVLMMLMGIYFFSDHVQMQLHERAVATQIISITLILLYFISLLVWKVLGGRLQAAVWRAEVAWSAMAPCLREHITGDVVESFDDISERNKYPTLLGGSPPTY